jgi:hypothetical protein
MEWVRDVIYVPGRMEVDWSSGWRQSKESSRGGLRDIDLKHLTDKQVATVRSKFALRALEQYGVEVETGYWPREVQSKLVDLMEELVADAGGSDKGTAAARSS